MLNWLASGSVSVLCAIGAAISISICAAVICLRLIQWYSSTQLRSHASVICRGTTPLADNTILPLTLHLHLPKGIYSAATLHLRMKCLETPQKLHLLVTSPRGCVGGGPGLLWLDCCSKFLNISMNSVKVVFNACISNGVSVLTSSNTNPKGKSISKAAEALPCSTKLAALYKSIRSCGSCRLWFSLMICSWFLTWLSRLGCSPCKNNHIFSACNIWFLLIRYFEIAQNCRWNLPNSAADLVSRCVHCPTSTSRWWTV